MGISEVRHQVGSYHRIQDFLSLLHLDTDQIDAVEHHTDIQNLYDVEPSAQRQTVAEIVVEAVDGEDGCIRDAADPV